MASKVKKATRQRGSKAARKRGTKPKVKATSGKAAPGVSCDELSDILSTLNELVDRKLIDFVKAGQLACFIGNYGSDEEETAAMRCLAPIAQRVVDSLDNEHGCWVNMEHLLAAYRRG